MQMQKQMQKSTDKEVSGIARYLRDRDVETRVSAARALAAIGPLGKPAVRDLIEALEGNEAEMLTWTCLALSVMEDAAAPAFSALKRLENHPDPAVKEAARTALGKIGNKAPVR